MYGTNHLSMLRRCGFGRSLATWRIHCCTVTDRKLIGSCHNRPLVETCDFRMLIETCRRTSLLSTSASFATLSSADNKTKEEIEKDEKVRRTARRMMLFFPPLFIIVIAAWTVYAGMEERDSSGNRVRDQFSGDSLLESILGAAKRAYYYTVASVKAIQEPSRDKLLPDPLRAPYLQPKYTICIEYNGVLLSPEYSVTTGWRFKKRPALDYFMEQVQYPEFEVVVYSADSLTQAPLIIDQLDPQWRCFMFRLYKDTTKWMNGHHIKDLSKLNRDLSKVIMIDWNPDSVKLNPENLLCIPRWQGDENDYSLVDLVQFLKTLKSLDVDDVRDVLIYYGGFPNPLSKFRENYQKNQEEADRRSKAADTGAGYFSKEWKGYFGRR